jgi:hypothetical protein
MTRDEIESLIFGTFLMLYRGLTEDGARRAREGAAAILEHPDIPEDEERFYSDLVGCLSPSGADCSALIEYAATVH